MSRALHWLFSVLVAAGFASSSRAAESIIDTNLVGTWRMVLPPPQNTNIITFEIKSNGTYTTTWENVQPPQREVGAIYGQKNEYQLRNVTRLESGIYWFNDNRALIMKGRYGTSTWSRVSIAVNPASTKTNAASAKATNSVSTVKPVTPEAVAEAERLQQLGLTYLEKDPKTAVSYLERAVATNPQNAEAAGNLSLALFKFAVRNGGRLTAGLHYLYECYRLDPKLRDKFERALVQEEIRAAGQTNSPEKRFLVPAERLDEIKAITLAAAACTAGGKAMAASGDIPSATSLAYFLRALEINPTYARARTGRGYAFYGFPTPNVGWAIYNLNAATRLDPNASEPKRHRGLIEMQLCLWEAAYDDFTAALQLKPDDEEILALRAITALLLERPAQANADKARIRQLDVLQGKIVTNGIDLQAKQIAAQKNTGQPLADEYGGDLEEARQWERDVRAQAAARALTAGDLREAKNIKSGGLIPDKYQQ